MVTLSMYICCFKTCKVMFLRYRKLLLCLCVVLSLALTSYHFNDKQAANLVDRVNIVTKKQGSIPHNGKVTAKNTRLYLNTHADVIKEDYPSTDRDIASKHTSIKHESNITTTRHETSVNCTLLAKKDPDEWRKAENLLRVKPYVPITEHDYLVLTSNCSSFIEQRGYHTTASSVEERDFPLAFGLRIHHKIEQFERLLRLIYMPQNIYCVYIDLKSSTAFHRAVKSIVKCLPNVFVASKLSNYIYASFSAVEADLQCMREVTDSPVQWKYFLNLAGTELPLKTNLELVTILKLLKGTNDIEQYPFMPYYEFRYKKIHYTRGSSVFMSDLRKPEFHQNVTIYKGSSYNSFSRRFVEWVLSDSLANSFIDWTRDIYSPDETVWGSLNLWKNAPGGYPFMVTQTSKSFLSREVIWTYSSAYCYGQYVRGICMLGFKELKWLKRRWEFFANKFDLSMDYIGFQCIEQWHKDRTAKPDVKHSINWEIINKLPQVRYASQYRQDITNMKDQAYV